MRKDGFLALVVIATLMAGTGFAAVAAPAPRGGTLIIADGVDAETLDGHLYTSSPTAERMNHICETLFELTPEGRLVPKLAVSYTISADGRRVTLKLRSGVKFHDGTPLDARAVKFNLDRILDRETRAPWRGLIDKVQEVVVLDPSTVVLLLSTPFAPLLAHLSHSGTCMQSPTAIATKGAGYARSPVGTGPFKFKEWVSGDRVVVTRFDDYWGEKANLDEIQWKVIPDDGARVAAVEAGTVHVAKRVPPREIERLRGIRALRVEIVPSLRTIFVAFNTQRPPFDNKKVRQALNYAVNKEAIVKAILGGTARVSDAPIAPAVQGYSKIRTYAYDPDRARALLREAGFPTGLKAVFHHPTGRYIRDVEIAAAIQGLVRRIGVDLELQTMDWATYVSFVRKPLAETTMQMHMLGWGTVTGDADYGLHQLFHSASWPPVFFNTAFYKNPQVDSLLDRARTTFDQSERNRLYREAMEIIMDDAPWIFLHNESQVTAYRAEVGGVFMHPQERLVAENGFLRR